MTSFSDDFITYAKEEDAANHQHTSNWIPCYVFITLVPFVFIGCALWSNRQRAAEKARASEWSSAPPPHHHHGWACRGTSPPTLHPTGHITSN